MVIIFALLNAVKGGFVNNNEMVNLNKECSKVCIRIVADCGTRIFQVTINFMRATMIIFTTISAIIFILC